MHAVSEGQKKDILPCVMLNAIKIHPMQEVSVEGKEAQLARVYHVVSLVQKLRELQSHHE
jgi:hypothetical protein